MNGDLIPQLDVSDLSEPGGTNLDIARVTPRAENVPTEISEAGFYFGLPLMLSVAGSLVRPAGNLLIRRLSPTQKQDRRTLTTLGMRLVTYEARLWSVASAHGAKSTVIPFASRVRSLRWWWEPGVGREPQVTLCIRCGTPEITNHATGPPYCRHCSDKRALTLPNTLAPHERGTWWIACAASGCRNAFVGHAQARYCPAHRQEKITPNRRSPRPK